MSVRVPCARGCRDRREPFTTDSSPEDLPACLERLRTEFHSMVHTIVVKLGDQECDNPLARLRGFEHH